jgi:hypothetical protein
MAVIGKMARSGKINIRSVRFMCDNEAAVKRCNEKQTKSVFHVNTSGKAGAQIPHLPLGDDSSPWGR